ncbi:MAG: UDP-2,3-diacylglucosamine diphosphatase [Candidatus Competibacter sp.]|jgi:UDP-2,3-diacylglucosamine pyrophosphatase LpxH|nr:UDP-2,3-diacylglucosamine diphosphatase [Gammaproteobacteria bacterium]MDG4560147.1 UDP-2,3-diacylglucosamine diphosphatase [Candidatus Competibacter sp.]
MQPYRYRAVWLSDVHLGFKDCKVQFLLDFLEVVECERLYLVGDLIDFWSLRKGGRWPAGHGRVLKSLLAKAKQGVRVIYIPGNHDEVARDYLGLLVGGVELVAEYEHHTADGRRFLVTHGDELDSAVKCGGWLTGMFGDWMYDVLLFANRWTNRLRRRLNYPYWSLANFLKPRIGQAAAYIARFEAAAAREARHRGFDGVICGHIHQAALRDIGGVCYANDGDWIESCTALVEHRDGRLEVLHWVDETARCRVWTAPAAAEPEVEPEAA